MKRFLVSVLSLFLIAALAACSQYEEELKANMENYEDAHYYEEMKEDANDYEKLEEYTHYYEEIGHEQDGEIAVSPVSGVIDTLEFSSLEDFLDAYLIANGKQRGNIEGFVSRAQASESDSDIMDIVMGAEFATLETLHLPIGIPDDFELGKIMVHYWLVVFEFFHRDDMISEDRMQEARNQMRHFSFSVTRWDYDDALLFDAMMQQSSPSCVLIDGKYLFTEWANSISWVADRNRFHLRTPHRQLDDSGELVEVAAIDGVSARNSRGMTRFAETVTLDLTNTAAINTMIAELAER